MAKFFSRKIRNNKFVLYHDDPDGRGTLLILTTGSGESNGPLSDYAENLLVSVLTKTLPILGPWRRIVVDVVRGRVGNLVQEHRANHVLLMGRQLATVLEKPSGLKKGTNLTGILVDYRGRRWVSTPSLYAYGRGEDRSGVSAAMLGHLYRHLELLRVGLIGWEKPNAPCREPVLVESRRDWERLRRLLATKPIVAIDTETNNLERINNTLLTIQFGFDGHRGWVLPVHHRDSRLPTSVLREAREWLKKYFERGKAATHVYANAVFDLHQLFSFLKLSWYNHKVWDVQAGAFNLDEMHQERRKLGFGKGEMWGLERLCLEAGMSHYQHSEIGKGDRARLATVDLELVAKYGALDVVLPLRLMKMQRALARWRNEHMHGRPYRHYDRAVIEVEGVKIQQFCAMERNGLLVDRKYVVSLQGPDSPVLREIREAERTFASLPEVAQANRLLLGTKNVRARTLFGAKGSISTVFDSGKPAHQQKLFFDVMKLKPVNERKDGSGSVDDEFKKQYKDNFVVKAFANLEEAKKLHSTFIAGYYKLLVRSPDNKDGWLRSKFGYLNVKTGRSASTEPNLQNIPSRNKTRAKIIKRQFVAAKGMLFLKHDMSAHEVRGWGITSGDKKIGESFWNGMKIRLAYEMQREIPREKEEWWGTQLKAADVHRQNYERLFGVPATKVTDEQRGGVKTTVFGSLYGYSMPTLGKVLMTTKLDGIKKAIKEIDAKVAAGANNLDELDEKKAQLQTELKNEAKKNWDAEAKSIYNTIFRKTFTVGGRWLEATQKTGAEHIVVRNMLGGVRHLWGYLHVERSAHSAMNRRGPNSVIQGPASNLGFRAGYEARKFVWQCFTSRGIDVDYRQCNSVHDSLENMVSIVNIPLMTYVSSHACTTMLHRFMRDYFELTPVVGFEMDMEIGPSLAELKKATRWNFVVDAVEHGIKWGNEHLGWDLDVDAYVKIVRHNAKIIAEIRRREIARQLKRGDRTNFYMEMNRDNALNYGLIFDPPVAKKREERREPRRLLLRELGE